MTNTRIRVLERGDDPYGDEWVLVAEFETASDPHVALRHWLLDEDPEPVAGLYEAVNDRGGHHRQTWTPPT